MNIENIVVNGDTVAMIFSHAPIEPGVHFYSHDDSSLQVGKQRRSKGEIIIPHKHKPVKVKREETLKEVLYIEKGKVKITFFSDQWKEADSRVVKAGDIVMLIKGGHGFEMLEDTEMIEIKQGPYDPAATVKMNHEHTI